MSFSLSRLGRFGMAAPGLTVLLGIGMLPAFICAAAAPGSAAEQKVQSLLARMTLEEKIGQMTQADLGALKDRNDITTYSLGSVLSGGDSDPENNLPLTWQKTARDIQELALKSRLKIPLLYGIDAVHGHNNVIGAVVFPHNIGLGATRNSKLVEKAATVTAREIAATDMQWAFGPCVAVAQDIRWGRTYESFGDDSAIASELGAAAVRGFQRKLPNGLSVIACAKHYAGDGGTQAGVDQGNTVCDEAAFRKIHVAPYKAAIKAGVQSVMVSYSSWNGQKMHGHKYLITDVLKGELAFKGFVVSDYAAIDQLGSNYKECIEKSINAGLDMIMIPNGAGQKNSYQQFLKELGELVAEGRVPQSRIDDAARRILLAKVNMGLFEHPFGDPDLLGQIGSAEHRNVARQCVRESLVLLKNEKRALPLPKRIRTLAVIGQAANDIGIQCGGWTITWQGGTGAITKGTTIVEGIRAAVGSGTKVNFSSDAAAISGAQAIVVVIGERPYAEMKGDRKDLSVPPEDAALVAKAKSAGVPVITVLVCGRPLVLGAVLENSDAVLTAWLPGTEGQGVADVLFGDAKPKGKLPRIWPAANDGLVSNVPGAKPQFPRGFGLKY